MTELMKENKLAKAIDDMCNAFEESQKEVGRLERENAQLKEQLRWRPVTQKPKEGQIVFAMTLTGWVVSQYLNGEFYIDDGFTFGDLVEGVIRWLPIPPAPEGE